MMIGPDEIIQMGKEIDELRAANAELKAKQAAWIIALEELSRWPDMPGVEFWTCPTNLPGPLPGNDKIEPGKFILHSEKIEGIFRAIEKHAKENFPSGAKAVEEWQDGFYKDNAIRLKKENAELKAVVDKLVAACKKAVRLDCGDWNCATHRGSRHTNLGDCGTHRQLKKALEAAEAAK